MRAPWTVLVLCCCCCWSAEARAACNASWSVAVPKAELLEDGRLLDVQGNVTYELPDFWSDGPRYLACPCNRGVCLLKCCPPGEELAGEGEGACLPARNQPIPSRIPLLPRNPCPPGPGFLTAEFTVTPRGQLVLDGDESVREAFAFCVDRKPGGEIVALVCGEDHHFSRITGGAAPLAAAPALLVASSIFAMMTFRNEFSYYSNFSNP